MKEMEKIRIYNKQQSQNIKDWETIPKFCKCNKLILILIDTFRDLETNNGNWENITWSIVEKLKELEKIA